MKPEQSWSMVLRSHRNNTTNFATAKAREKPSAVSLAYFSRKDDPDHLGYVRLKVGEIRVEENCEVPNSTHIFISFVDTPHSKALGKYFTERITQVVTEEIGSQPEMNMETILEKTTATITENMRKEFESELHPSSLSDNINFMIGIKSEKFAYFCGWGSHPPQVRLTNSAFQINSHNSISATSQGKVFKVGLQRKDRYVIFVTQPIAAQLDAWARGKRVVKQRTGSVAANLLFNLTLPESSNMNAAMFTLDMKPNQPNISPHFSVQQIQSISNQKLLYNKYFCKEREETGPKEADKPTSNPNLANTTFTSSKRKRGSEEDTFLSGETSTEKLSPSKRNRVEEPVQGESSEEMEVDEEGLEEDDDEEYPLPSKLETCAKTRIGSENGNGESERMESEDSSLSAPLPLPVNEAISNGSGMAINETGAPCTFQTKLAESQIPPISLRTDIPSGEEDLGSSDSRPSMACLASLPTPNFQSLSLTNLSRGQDHLGPVYLACIVNTNHSTDLTNFAHSQMAQLITQQINRAEYDEPLDFSRILATAKEELGIKLEERIQQKSPPLPFTSTVNIQAIILAGQRLFIANLGEEDDTEIFILDTELSMMSSHGPTSSIRLCGIDKYVVFCGKQIGTQIKYSNDLGDLLREGKSGNIAEEFLHRFPPTTEEAQTDRTLLILNLEELQNQMNVQRDIVGAQTGPTGTKFFFQDGTPTNDMDQSASIDSIEDELQSNVELSTDDNDCQMDPQTEASAIDEQISVPSQLERHPISMPVNGPFPTFTPVLSPPSNDLPRGNNYVSSANSFGVTIQTETYPFHVLLEPGFFERTYARFDPTGELRNGSSPGERFLYLSTPFGFFKVTGDGQLFALQNIYRYGSFSHLPPAKIQYRTGGVIVSSLVRDHAATTGYQLQLGHQQPQSGPSNYNGATAANSENHEEVGGPISPNQITPTDDMLSEGPASLPVPAANSNIAEAPPFNQDVVGAVTFHSPPSGASTSPQDPFANVTVIEDDESESESSDEEGTISVMTIQPQFERQPQDFPLDGEFSRPSSLSAVALAPSEPPINSSQAGMPNPPFPLFPNLHQPPVPPQTLEVNGNHILDENNRVRQMRSVSVQTDITFEIGTQNHVADTSNGDIDQHQSISTASPGPSSETIQTVPEPVAPNIIKTCKLRKRKAPIPETTRPPKRSRKAVRRRSQPTTSTSSPSIQNVAVSPSGPLLQPKFSRDGSSPAYDALRNRTTNVEKINPVSTSRPPPPPLPAIKHHEHHDPANIENSSSSSAVNQKPTAPKWRSSPFERLLRLHSSLSNLRKESRAQKGT